MAGKSTYLANEILDHILGGADWPRPATVYIALYTAAPTDAGGGTEVSTNNYSRAAVTNNATNFPAASGGAKANGADITFAVPSGSWGLCTHFGVFDALTTGNLLYWGALSSSQTPTTGNTVKIPTGDLDITED
jgi:hypothetical protein